MENVRIYEMPACKMISSGCGMFGEEKFDRFDHYFSSLPRTMFPNDFLWHDGKGFVWFYIYSDGMHVPEEFEMVDFPGGFYAVATDIDGQDNSVAIATIKTFIEDNGCFAEDTSRAYLGNVITSPSISKVLGYAQMNYYIPIKIK